MLNTAQIPCPEPIMLRSHVLLMGFIGKGDRPAPLLKNAQLSDSKVRELYLQIIQYMRRMYQDARLVHADLSEFNMLYHGGDVYIIDVSQAVEHDHPHALEFLRKDCANVNGFFQKHNVAVMTVRELFEFITDPSITSENIDDYLTKAMEIASKRTEEERSSQDKVDEEVSEDFCSCREMKISLSSSEQWKLFCFIWQNTGDTDQENSRDIQMHAMTKLPVCHCSQSTSVLPRTVFLPCFFI
uniref:non-specific serine/threonine protein kinase n=1 Tax=Pavo cristatus TaxID=9049 RepID=A0A8C9EVZ7_PAVCR